MKLECNYIIYGLAFWASLFLPGCFPEGVDGCPERMLISFYLEDQHDESGDFDSRIANDVYLFIFKDRALLNIQEIPYEEVKNGNQFIVDKALGIEGTIDLIAWAVSANVNKDDYIPQWTEGNSLDQITLSLQSINKADGKYIPVTTAHYIGSNSSVEYIDQETIYRIPMQVTPCRVEVNIADLGNTFSSAQNVYVEVNGTMDQMNLQKQGVGSVAVVEAPLDQQDKNDIWWTTGQIGVLPSSADQMVSVEIFADERLIERLDVPRESLPQGAVSGGLLVFEYTLGQAHYFITVDGFQQKIVMINDM